MKALMNAIYTTTATAGVSKAVVVTNVRIDDSNKRITKVETRSSNTCAKVIMCLQEAKESFASPDYLFYCSGHTGELGWPEVHSILLTGCPAFSQGTFCHFWMAGVGVTCDQPKGVKLGISNIPNYKDSLIK